MAFFFHCNLSRHFLITWRRLNKRDTREERSDHGDVAYLAEGGSRYTCAAPYEIYTNEIWEPELSDLADHRAFADDQTAASWLKNGCERPVCHVRTRA